MIQAEKRMRDIKLRIAVVKPGIARKQTAFEAMAELYRYMYCRYDADVTIFLDYFDDYADQYLKIVKLKPVQIPKTLNLLKLPTYKFYPSLTGKVKGYDVIITSDPSLYLEHCYPAFLAARRNRARLLVDLSLTLPIPRLGNRLKDRIKRHMWRQVADYTYRFLATTPLAVKRFHELGICRDPNKFLVLGHPVNIHRFRPRPPDNEVTDRDQTIILSVGRLVPEKGLQYILKALLPIFRERASVKWYIVGEGPYEADLRELIRRNRLEGQVELMGPVPHEELPSIYQCADIFVGHPISTPYWEEFFGVVYVEAMACGLPVISSYCGGVPHVVPDGHAGYLVPQKDVTQLTEKLWLLIDDVELRKQLGKQARNYVAEHYSVEKLGEKLYSACSEIL